MEEKEKFKESDHLAVRHLIKRLIILDMDFRKHHLAIVETIEEDEEKLEEEQALLDEHNDRVSGFMERLLGLEFDDKPEEHKSSLSVSKPKPDPSHRLYKRLQYIENRMRTINDEIKPLIPGPDLDVSPPTLGSAGQPS